MVKQILILCSLVGLLYGQTIRNDGIRGLAGRVFNVVDYGATGNGTTDDTAAMQRAIDAALVGQGEVIIPTGTYKISSKLVACSSFKYVKITGSGQGTVIMPSTDFPEITTDSSSAAFDTDCGNNLASNNLAPGPVFRDLKVKFTQTYTTPKFTVTSGVYRSGITATGSVGQTCTLASFNGGGSAAEATVALTDTNTIADFTPLVITEAGSNYTSRPTSATAGSGTATCSGTATVSIGLTSSNRTTLKKWLGFHLDNTQNVTMENVIIEEAWDGISFKGTYSDGAWVGVTGRGYFANVGINAFNVSVDIDGMTDSTRFIGVHLWPYAADRHGWSLWWQDPNAIGYQIGRADDVNITNGLGITGTHFNFVDGADGQGSFTKITGYGFDSFQGIMLDGFHSVNVSNSTASFTGGTSGPSSRFMKVNKGSLSWTGGYISAVGYTGPVIELDYDYPSYTMSTEFRGTTFGNNDVTGVKFIQQKNNADTDLVTLLISNCMFFAYSSQTDTAPYVSVEQADTGLRLVFKDNIFSRTGPTYVRTALAIATDNYHEVTDNHFRYVSATEKWTVTNPTAKALGKYQDEQDRPINPKVFIADTADFSGENVRLRWLDTNDSTSAELSLNSTGFYFDKAEHGSWTWRGPSYTPAMSITTTGVLGYLKEIWLDTGVEGTCDSSNRGRIVMVQGGAGVADTFRICAKDASNNYNWTALF